MFKGRDREIAELLSNAGLLSQKQIASFTSQAFEQSRVFAECVLSSGTLTVDQLLDAVANYLELDRRDGYQGVAIGEERIHHILSQKVAKRYGVVVLGETDECYHLAVADPFDPKIEMDLEHYFERPVKLYVTDPEWVALEIKRIYPELESDVDLTRLNNRFQRDRHGSENSATIIDYVDALLQKSIQDGASDIHFEPFEHCFRVRYRVDGYLKEIPSQTDHLGTAIVSRIKVMASLNIAETRIPQDGRIRIQSMGRLVDVRVSTLPTQFGESVVLRILDKARVHLDLDMLGLPDDVLQRIRLDIQAPNGIFLATGPTGSGKTTTLYSALRELNDPGVKILTVEDPVEYDIDGIMQVQTHGQIGLDFSRVLRSFLRHDPDKILLGEIRDTETARIAVQASLTGHMVFSSLHTNDAAGAVTRFVDMGVEPYLVAASLLGVLAQRLLRRLDPDGMEAYVPEDHELELLDYSRKELGDHTFFRTLDAKSGKQHYRGRVGLYEYLVMNDSFREAITQGLSHSELFEFAKSNGMRDLRSDGIRALMAGHTTVEEVIRYT